MQAFMPVEGKKKGKLTSVKSYRLGKYYWPVECDENSLLV